MDFERVGNCIRFKDTNGITYDMWKKILNRINYLGYAIPSEHDLKEYFDRHILLNEDQSIEVLNVFGEEHEDDLISEEMVEHYVKKAKKHFGITNTPSLAGYLLTDGTFLKLSYGSYLRDIDHREIDEIFDEDMFVDKTNAMIYFINLGNVRLKERGFELIRPLTKMQKAMVGTLIREAHIMHFDYTYMYVDIANKEGRVVKTFEYEFPSAGSIIADIDAYFESIKL